MDSKSDLRKYAKELRKKLDIKNISKKLVAKIRTDDWYKTSNHIMIYYPMKYEIDLLDLLKDNKNFYLPKVQCENLCVCPYTSVLKNKHNKLCIFKQKTFGHSEKRQIINRIKKIIYLSQRR